MQGGLGALHGSEEAAPPRDFLPKSSGPALERGGLFFQRREPGEQGPLWIIQRKGLGVLLGGRGTGGLQA